MDSFQALVRKLALARWLRRTYLYVRHQRALSAADRADLASTAKLDIPLPPARLRHRVHGDLSAENFLKLGKRVSDDLRTLLASVGRKAEDFTCILDFGCGCGRVLRYFDGLPVYGTDIDPELIEWCQTNIDPERFKLNAIQPPAPFAAGQFDWVYAISVFTHLPEDMQRAWLTELARITRGGGIVILTFHGEEIAKGLGSECRRALTEKGFFYRVGATGKLKIDGLPDFYQTSYQTFEYLENECSENFEVLAKVPKAINAHQDAIVLQRKTTERSPDPS